MLGTGYFLKINCQQEKPMCPSVVNAVRPFFTISQFYAKAGFNYFTALILAVQWLAIDRSHTTLNRDFLESISFSF